MSGRKKLILGIDPGTTCGIAALDLNGNLLLIKSQRELLRSEVVDLTLSIGEPVAIASDVSHLSEYVKKIASSLNAVLYMPEQSLTAEKKGELTRAFSEKTGLDLKDTHERDALAAALKAYHHFENKLRQVETRVDSLGVRVPLDELKALVIRGTSIQNSIDRFITPREDLEPQTSPAPEESAQTLTKDSLINRLRDRISRQKEQISRLRQKNYELTGTLSTAKLRVNELTKEIERLGLKEGIATRRERRYRLLRNEVVSLRRAVQSLQNQVQSYEERLTSLRDARAREVQGEAILLKPVERFSATGIEKACELYRIVPGDRVLLQDASGGGPLTSRQLAELGVSIVVAGPEMEHEARNTFRSLDISVIPLEELSISWVEGYPYASSVELEEKLKKQRASERLLVQEEIESEIAKYREERKVQDPRRA